MPANDHEAGHASAGVTTFENGPESLGNDLGKDLNAMTKDRDGWRKFVFETQSANAEEA